MRSLALRHVCLHHLTVASLPAANLHYYYFGLHVKYPCFCRVLMKLEFSIQNFVKFTNVKCHEIQFGGSRVVVCGPDKTNSRFAQFCESAKKIIPMKKKHVVQQRHFAQPIALDLPSLPI